MKDKFQILQPWLPQIIHTIKKEIKTEHLAKSPVFYKANFGNRPQNRITNEEICAVYERELLEGTQEELGEWIVNRWVFRHGDIYRHFAERLSQIHPDFDQIQQLNEAESKQILAGAVESFGALPVYLFTVLNGVVFPEQVLSALRKKAELETSGQQEEEKIAQEKQSFEQLAERYRADVARLERKYEDKLAGVMKKYTVDLEALKKQIRSLQQKLTPS